MTIPRALRRALPWSAGWVGLPAGLAVAGRLLARRRNEGDESTAGIRRVVAVGGVRLRPVNPTLSRLRFDVLLGGAEVDLTAIPRVPGGVDATVRAVLGKVALRVPPDWRVWSEFRGLAGGVGTGDGVTATQDERGADLRLHVRAVCGGVGVEAGADRPG